MWVRYRGLGSTYGRSPDTPRDSVCYLRAESFSRILQMPSLTLIRALNDEKSRSSSTRSCGDNSSITPGTTIAITQPPARKRPATFSNLRIESAASATPAAIATTLHKMVRNIVNQNSTEQCYEMALAIMKAAPAARLPINAVCRALRIGRVPVNRPLMSPKMNTAASVVAIEINSAVCVLRVNI